MTQHIVCWIAGALLILLGAAGASHSALSESRAERWLAIVVITVGALVWRYA